MKVLPWVKAPAVWIREDGLRDFGWSRSSLVSRSTAIAALQLYIVLVTRAAEEESEENESRIRLMVELTYNELVKITGLSRPLVASGIAGLVAAELIAVEKVGRKSQYEILGYTFEGNWFKLPARTLYNPFKMVIPAFHMFQKRSVCELDALKMFLYFAFARDRTKPFSMCSFETICERTGVAEKRIPRANAFLLNCGLLANITRENVESRKVKEANKYFLSGHTDLFVGQPIPQLSRVTVTPDVAW